MTKIPDKITLCKLDCILMPNGEIICGGKTIGWFKNFKDYLSPSERENDVQTRE